MEEARIREPVLSEMYPDKRHQLRHQLHLQGPQEQAGGGQDRGVCALWVPRVLWLGIYNFLVKIKCSDLW